MKYTHSILARCFLALLLLPAYARAQPKLLNFSKFGPDTRMLLNHYANWETTSPFDGLNVAFHSNTVNTSTSTGYLGKSTTEELTFNVFKPANTINYSDYSRAIEDMNNCTFTKFKNNFMMLSLFDYNWIRWSDATNWHKMIANLGVAAKIAKDSKLKGIILDTEEYGSPQNLNLLLYCAQFITEPYALKNSSGFLAYGRIQETSDIGTIDDLFPQSAQNIYWKDPLTNIANGVQLLPASGHGVLRDAAENYYYLLLNPAYKTDIEQISEDVKQRGAEIINAIKNNFPDAEIILTVAPSDIHYDFANALGMTPSSNYLRAKPSLSVPLLEGMLAAAEGSNLQIIDGQEQTYYLKDRTSFMNARGSFDWAEKYFDNSTTKSLYRNNMLRAYGLYPSTVNSPYYNPSANTAYRYFTPAQLQDQYRYASEFPDIKYLWQWEEDESFWLDPGLASHKFDGTNPSFSYGDTDAIQYINNINNGQNALKNFVVHNDEYLYLKNANITGKNILVEPGGTLRFNGKFSLSGSHSITFDNGSYCCMDNNTNLTLTNFASFINFVPGYFIGVKSPLPDGSNCSSTFITTPVTGDGSINTFDKDVYIQNDILTGDQYIVGKNIYIGYDVAPARTQGEVKINDFANIIFKAAERVKMTRNFNVETGSTYLIK